MNVTWFVRVLCVCLHRIVTDSAHKPSNACKKHKEQVGEATVEKGDGQTEAVEVLLRPYLDPEAGGLSWRPLEAEHGMRCVSCLWCR